jgi:hypothetical protein
MRRTFALRLTLALCVALGATARAQSIPSLTLALPQYIQTLDDTLAGVRSLRENPQNSDIVRRSLESAWHVEVEGRVFEVPTQTILQDFDAWKRKPTDEALDRVVQELETLHDQAIATQAHAPDFAARHATLNSILARREFRDVHGQTWLDRLKQKITDLLLKWLGRVISASVIPTISNILVYGLMILAVLALAYWMYRSLREGARLESIMPVAVPVSAKQWPIWLSEARAAAARNNWRDAIHLAYWGGISFLEAQGAWRPDEARTPREYLQLLSATSTHQPALRGLTTRLESVWYGMQAADAEAFQQTVVELERLGCPCS